jgi:hypothetical protein
MFKTPGLLCLGFRACILFLALLSSYQLVLSVHVSLDSCSSSYAVIRGLLIIMS